MAGAAWEYRVNSIGGILKGANPEQLTEVLNRAAADGWELTHMVPQENSNGLWLVLRRPSTQRTRREAAWTREG
jgi:hypothetical protein